MSVENRRKIPASAKPTYSPFPLLPDGSALGQWWHTTEELDRIECTLCPRGCKIKPGDRGFCFVRENRDGQMVLSTYGKSTGFCIDPIEKKPLNHFFPGTSVLSFGTAGCNLGCKFCQNWDISKSRQVEKLSTNASPEAIALAAADLNCQSVAFTYNDPVIWAEYAIDTAQACHEHNIKTIAVTAGYIHPSARSAFFATMDAANVDLKAFTEEFYYKITYSHLQPVLDTLIYLKNETNVWFEITNLIIPNANDSHGELKRMCDWILNSIGDRVPIHFSAFHPDFRMTDRPNTPIETLIDAYDIARQTGLKYVYVGNVHDKHRQNTYCPNCNELLIQRDWHQLGTYTLHKNCCSRCGTVIDGHFGDQPGSWGGRRQKVDMNLYQNQAIHGGGQPSLPVLPAHETLSSHYCSPHSQKNYQPMNTESAASSNGPITAKLPAFTEAEKQQILRATAKLIIAAASGLDSRKALESLSSEISQIPVAGIFVTLHRDSQLRGCCGSIGGVSPLSTILAHSAYRTAKEDPRFPPVAISEVPHLSLDVTILSPSYELPTEAVNRYNAIEIGRHGLRIQLGQNAGLLLPSVPIEQNWNKDEFLAAICKKANLPLDAWKNPDAKLEAFEGLSFGKPMSELIVGDKLPKVSRVANDQQIAGLTALAIQNITAIQQRATPSYYNAQLPEGSVCGILLTIEVVDSDQVTHLTRLQLQPKLPLQTTLYQLSEATANLLPKMGNQHTYRIFVSVLYDPIINGSVNLEIDQEINQGIDEELQLQNRAIFVVSGNRTWLLYDPNISASDLHAKIRSAPAFQGRSVTLYSFAIDTLLPRIESLNLPQAETNSKPRIAAVAGTFYPAEDNQRIALVDELLLSADQRYQVSHGGNSEKVACRAIMTPHAGLKYSGSVAASVWGRVQIPSSVLIIGPKHTRDGVDWAVSPHASWNLSDNTQVLANQELAEAISAKVDHMKLDAVAHRAEHGIEVQLPFLHRLAPTTKVAAIAMQYGTWPQIQKAAAQLADLLLSLPDLPLLVISSDMNHFADDRETRRRDAMALEAFQAADPYRLLEVCRQHEISMCGVLPAALILQTLKELSTTVNVQPLEYKTSAEVSGDTSRVVGYASALVF